jgi:hypothetical protein
MDVVRECLEWRQERIPLVAIEWRDSRMNPKCLIDDLR